jgi:hypothetical protein
MSDTAQWTSSLVFCYASLHLAEEGLSCSGQLLKCEHFFHESQADDRGLDCCLWSLQAFTEVTYGM